MAAGDLITLAALKLRMGTVSVESDAELEAVITSASAAIAKHTSRDLAPLPGLSRTFTASEWPELGLWVGDLRTITSAVVIADADGTTTASVPAASFVLEPRSKPSDEPYNRIRPKSTAVGAELGANYSVTVTGDYGFAAVPAVAQEACVITCRAWLREASGAFAGVVDPGTGYPVAPTPAGTWMLPMAAKQLLTNLRRRGVV